MFKIQTAMKSFLKYLGPILQLVGVAILAIYYFNQTPENTLLAVAGIIMVLGMVGHIVINRLID